METTVPLQSEGSAQEPKTQDVRLSAVQINVQFGSDGVDEQTQFELAVYHPTKYPQIAYYDQMAGIGDNTFWTKQMTLKDNRIKKDELKETIIYIALNTTSHDDANGKPSVTFSYSDGEVITLKYRPFDLGTHGGKSHRTDNPVENW